MSVAFISYRRNDVPFAIEQLERHLEDAFERDSVFRDTSDIEAGADFRDALRTAIRRHSVLIVAIGPHWDPSRLHDADDYVRFEISTALALGRTVLPILIGDAEWPTASELPNELVSLATTHHVRLRSGQDLRRDLDAIVAAVSATCPITLTGTLPGRILLGRARVWLDGQEVATGLALSDVAFGPVVLAPGVHSLRVSIKLGPIGSDEEFRFELRRPGAWHLSIDYHRTSGKISYDLSSR